MTPSWHTFGISSSELWFLTGVIDYAPNTVPSPDSVIVSICADDNGGSIPGTLIQEVSLTFTLAASWDWNIETIDPLVVGTDYWLTLERSGSLDNTLYYEAHGIDGSSLSSDTGLSVDPPTTYIKYDGSSWNSGTKTLFNVTGFNLPPGANSWGNLDDGTKVSFGTTTVQKLAQKFHA